MSKYLIGGLIEENICIRTPYDAAKLNSFESYPLFRFRYWKYDYNLPDGATFQHIIDLTKRYIKTF